MPSTTLRRIAKALTTPVRLHSIPTPVIAGLLLAVTLGWTFFAYGQRTNIPFHTILWGAGLGSRSNIVINDQVAWSSFWTTYICRPGQCPIPEVNFTLRTVLVVSLGSQPEAGDSINITRVTSIGSSVLVDIRITVLGSHCGFYDIYGTSPGHIVDIPKAHGPVMFRTETMVRNC